MVRMNFVSQSTHHHHTHHWSNNNIKGFRQPPITNHVHHMCSTLPPNISSPIPKAPHSLSSPCQLYHATFCPRVSIVQSFLFFFHRRSVCDFSDLKLWTPNFFQNLAFNETTTSTRSSRFNLRGLRETLQFKVLVCSLLLHFIFLLNIVFLCDYLPCQYSQTKVKIPLVLELINTEQVALVCVRCESVHVIFQDCFLISVSWCCYFEVLVYQFLV